MGAKHNLPSLENAMMDSPDRENFDGTERSRSRKMISYCLNMVPKFLPLGVGVLDVFKTETFFVK